MNSDVDRGVWGHLMGDAGAPHFLAVDLDDAARHELATRLTDAFADMRIPGSVVPPENWHLTLRYFGPLAPHSLELLRYHLSESWLGRGFRLQLDGLGAFPKPIKASVLWVGTGDGTEDLIELKQLVDESIEHIGYGPEDRPFQPHLTLSRLRPPVDVWPWLEADPILDVSLKVNAVTLFRSHKRPTTYEPLDRFSL